MPVKMQLLRVFISAKAGNLDTEQLEQPGSVKLHLIKRVTAVQSHCWVLLCIANEQPGFRNREAGDGSIKHQNPSVHPCPSSSSRVPPVPPAQAHKGHRRGLCCTGTVPQVSCPASSHHRSCFKGFRRAQLAQSQAVCPRQPLQCHSANSTAENLNPIEALWDIFFLFCLYFPCLS